MKRSDVVVLVVGGVGLFLAGVVWRPVFGDSTILKEAIECTSYLATTAAALVAIYTLNIWKAQFRHAERFSSLRILKDAITDMHLYRGHLLAVINMCSNARENNGVPDKQLIDIEQKKREQLKLAFSNYKKAWAAAVVFFTPDEERNFPGPPNHFMTLYLTRVQGIHDAHKKYSTPGQSAEFEAIAESYNLEAMEIFKDTLDEVESMLRRKV